MKPSTNTTLIPRLLKSWKAAIFPTFLMLLFLAPNQGKACHNSSLALDSVVCEDGGYRIYMNLCLGGGVLGPIRGADGPTGAFAFALYSSDTTLAVQAFTPAIVTGDSTGISLSGAVFGTLVGSQATVAYLPIGPDPYFMCVSSTNDCGTPHTQCDQYSIFVNEIPDSIRMLGAEGAGNPIAGCFPNSNMVIPNFPVFTTLLDAGLDTLIARGDTLTLGGTPTLTNGPASPVFSWTPPTYLSNPASPNPIAWPQSTTTYEVSIGNQLACPDSVTVTVDTACVWPGDCNYDFAANYLDLLSVGLAYGFVGPVRPIQGTAWACYPSYEWNNTFPNGINYKHNDADGNGLVGIDDVQAIVDNYQLTHNGNRLNATQNNDIYFFALPQSVIAGDSLWVGVGLGTTSLPADSVYGIGFQLNYTASLVDSGGIVVQYNNSWIGTESVDMVTLDVDHYSSGTIDIAMTRINHQEVSGQGEICRIGIAMQDDISGKTRSTISEYLNLVLSGVVMTSADASQRLLGGQMDSVEVFEDPLLPVSWFELRGKDLPQGIQLDWSSVSEIHADYFTIERAAPNQDFVSLGELESDGNSSPQQEYQFMDRSPLLGENRYRIAETNKNGETYHSETISVFRQHANEIVATSPPNIQNDQLTLEVFSPISQTATYQLFDLQGRKLFEQSVYLEVGNQTFQTYLEPMSSGVYLFQIQTKTSKYNTKLIHN